MLPLLQSVTGFQGVANSGNGTLRLANRFRYHKLTIFTTVAGALANPTTVASNIKLKVDGVTIRDMSPDQCIRLAKFHGITPGTGEIPIFFSEPWLADPRTREMFSWDLVGQGPFTLEMTFLNPGGGAVGIQKVVAEVDTVRNQLRSTVKGAAGEPFLRIIKAKNETFISAGAGRLGDVAIDRTLPIRRLFCDVSAGVITDVSITADSVSLYDQIIVATELADVLNQWKKDGTQFTGVALAFDMDGLARSKLIAQNLEVKFNFSAAATLTILNMQEASSFS